MLLSNEQLELAQPETSSSIFDIKAVKVIMPIGGLGTRAADVTNNQIPKHLIELDSGQPVLDVICEQLQGVGFRQFIFCVGHHKDQIMEHIGREEWLRAAGTTYRFSEEKAQLGVDGAVMHAIESLDLDGQGMIIPGDLFLSWEGLVRLNQRHAASGADVTFGTTSHTTERTTDVGKIIAEEGTGRLLWCYGRNDESTGDMAGARALTSVGTNVVSLNRYLELRDAYLSENPTATTLSLRDQIAKWALQAGGFEIHAYDIGGEILDLGTPSNIQYGQNNWQSYMAA
jgi:NDP-sugar pyrophosphorylase family protein